MKESADEECSLSPEVALVAREELREEQATRAQALAQLRDWIRKNPDIKNCRTDALFLLRFLRTKKFSVVQAEEMLERYLAMRQIYPVWYTGLDPYDKQLAELIDAGYCFPLRERDQFGRRVVMARPAQFDPHRYTSQTMVRLHATVLECLADDHENQIKGFTYVCDLSGVSLSLVSLLSFTELRDLIKCIQHSVPVRHKTSHYVNLPSFANKIFEFFFGLLSEKLRKRTLCHKSIEELYEHVDVKILPKEYGGTVPIQDMIDDFKKELSRNRERLVGLDRMEIELKTRQKLVSEFDDQLILGVAGSFRMLQVD